MRFLLTKYSPGWGAIFLRLALGTVFMAHGWGKLSGPLATSDGFNIEGWGWPYPALWAWLVALVETFGGLMVITGLFTRVAAFLLACEMVVAIVYVRLGSGFVGGFEFELTLLLVALSLVTMGGGRLSVDRDVLGLGLAPRGRAVAEGEN